MEVFRVKFSAKKIGFIERYLPGIIPSWLNGVLIRNGPGSLKVGNDEFRHLFDSSALLHR